jgi:hypothetical protein
VVERRPLDREVRDLNLSHDGMALLLGRHYEFPHCGIIKEKLLLLLLKYTQASLQFNLNKEKRQSISITIQLHVSMVPVERCNNICR